MTEEEFIINPEWVGDGLQYEDPAGTFEGIPDECDA
jgi:hypothetical protein